jgi:hypothetical protein
LPAALPGFASAGAFTWVEDVARGGWTLQDGEVPVLTYVLHEQLPDGVNPAHRRACYVHPLYDLDGRPLTEAFPADHLHHRGIWLSWPRMTRDGRDVQLWHPSPMRQRFAAWDVREADAEGAQMTVRQEWVLDGTAVATEILSIRAGEATGRGRALDLTWRLEAADQPIELLGAVDKGYGGMTIRLDPSFRGQLMTTDTGPLAADAVHERFRWADISSPARGVAVFVHPEHAGSPLPWMVRNSYGGVLNPSWPALETTRLLPEQPVVLSYRLYIHRGDAQTGGVQDAFEEYLQATRPGPS